MLSLLRLVAGGASAGRTELRRQLETMDRASDAAQAPDLPEVGSTADRLWYAMIGMLAEAPDRVERGMEAIDRVSRRPRAMAAAILGPIASSRLVRPVRRQVVDLDWRGRALLDRWVEAGRREEAAGRRMVQHLTDEEVDRLLDYLSEKPEVREMVTVQAVGIMDEMVGEVRDQSVTADARVDRLVSRALRRPARTPAPAPPPRLRQRYLPVTRRIDEGS
jgi:hypothetical protein